MASKQNTEYTSTQVYFDPHFHLWDVVSNDALHDRELLGKAGEAFPVYTINCLNKDAQTAGMELMGAVHIEALAADGVGEALWAMKEAAKWDHPLMVVGRVDLSKPDAVSHFKAMKDVDTHDCLRGIRHILNFEPSWPWVKHDEYLTDATFEANYKAMADYDLSFDLQANPHQLPAAAALAKKYPNVPVIVNHFGCLKLHGDAAKREKAIEEWRTGMKALAEAGSHVHVKISMLAYCDPEWDKDSSVVPSLVKEIVDLFGSERCMYASNYPVDSGEFEIHPERLWAGFAKLCRGMSAKDRENLYYQTALRAYRVDQK
eukprot:TRINITY_DN10977_c0_g1_i2.p2 TRINITY_DN10977_c0_g1~~TRINITY_DN10977_c0_g1_i2.p2  ORF type:complete len:317 (+),score=57.52 TRINITY_DN10977_c0_g1_i2:1194-2144(+)